MRTIKKLAYAYKMTKTIKYTLIGAGAIIVYQAIRTAMALMNIGYYVTGCSIYSISLQNMVVRLGLRITNKSSQALILQNIDTVFYMDGEQVGYIYQSFPSGSNNLLNKYDFIDVTLDCNISTMDIVSKVYSLLVTKSENWKQIQFRTTGTITANGITFPVDITTPITSVVPTILQ